MRDPGGGGIIDLQNQEKNGRFNDYNLNTNANINDGGVYNQ